MVSRRGPGPSRGGGSGGKPVPGRDLVVHIAATPKRGGCREGRRRGAGGGCEKVGGRGRGGRRGDGAACGGGRGRGGGRGEGGGRKNGLVR